MTKAEILQVAKNAPRVDKDQIIEKVCAGKSVLDVGCIGQDRNYKDETWLHNKVKKFSKHVDGVDILTEEIKELRSKGYSIYHVDELKTSGKKYDVILMADVIEHVDNPVEFLSFYSSFASDDGVLLITTPNSNRANNFVHIFFNNNYSVNPEHTFWFCPRTFAEVTDRAKLKIKTFYWADHYFRDDRVKGFYQKFKLMIINLLIRKRSNFSPNMIFLLGKP
jgi:2-polyprenyl-3-methyl-5-hydroxy-6-metoxy-1,4-benzoquinol methylase